MHNLGKRLKKLMTDSGVNQPLLSKMTGVPQSTIQRILSGAIKSPKNDHLIPIASYFGIPLDDLLGLSKYSNNIPDSQAETGDTRLLKLAEMIGISEAALEMAKEIDGLTTESKSEFITFLLAREANIKSRM